MVGTGSRLFFALAALGLLGAGLYGVATGGDPVGVLSMGYKSGVGEHFGYTVLAGFGLVSLMFGVITVIIRDADPALVAVGTGSETALPESPAPASASPWPMVGALGLVIAALGLVEGSLLFVVGVVMVGITVFEWTVTAWADRATGDPEVNAAIRSRLMAPIELPISAALVIAFIVLGVSRVFLAVSSLNAVWIAIGLACMVLIAAVFILLRPKDSGKLATILVILGAIAIIAGGISGVAHGSREFHEEAPAHEAGE